MKKIALVTNIAQDTISGGFSAMNRAMFDVLAKDHEVDYIGPINPKPDLGQHALSKSRRLMGLGGDFFFFSERRLEVIRKEVEGYLNKSGAKHAVFHGFTPWIHVRPTMPYVAWSDCTFWQYVHIYHDAGCFRTSDLERIKEVEAAWLRNAERVIFRSEWAASSAIQDYNLDKNRVGVVRNYGFITPPACDVYEGGQDFLMVTTDFRQKGGFVAIEAFKLVRQSFPNARLLIVGDYPGKSALQDPGVVYLGWIDKSNPDHQVLLSRTFAQARCLLHPTIADTNPMVIIEAGYFGCPAISTKRYAIPELVMDGVSGILLDDPTDVPALVNAMIRMLQPNESYSLMRRSARSHVLGNFTREKFEHRLNMEIGTSKDASKVVVFECGMENPEVAINRKPTDLHCMAKRGWGGDYDSSLPTINFITNIPLEEISGGFSGMSFAAYEALRGIANINYVGPVNPPINILKKLESKSRRMIGIPGEFYFFSKERLQAIANEVRDRCNPSADFDFYHGFTPWIHCSTPRPYVAWSDCSFRDYLTIYHDSSGFIREDWERICNKEREWLDSAKMVFLTSEWAGKRLVSDYALPTAKVKSVGIFGAMEPPDADMWDGSKDFYFISTDYKQKDGALCRLAMDLVWERYPDARLRIIGSMPPSSDLVPGKVTYEGFFRKSDPDALKVFRSHLANAFAIIHPTKADITPLILIEAAFFGCPAISVDDFALRELTSSNNSEFLLPRPLSAENLAAAMISLLADHENYMIVRRAARDFAISNLTRDAFKTRLNKAVSDCMSMSVIA